MVDDVSNGRQCLEQQTVPLLNRWCSDRETTAERQKQRDNNRETAAERQQQRAGNTSVIQ